MERIALAEDFDFSAQQLADTRISANVGFEAAEPFLQLMEVHPAIDFEAPDPLVSFVEQFYKKGCQAKLLHSVRIKPATHAASMLSNNIHGILIADKRHIYIAALAQTKLNPFAGRNTFA